jgi:UDP-N-acetylglucosamine 2-epimerase
MLIVAVCGAGGLDPSAPLLGALDDAGVEVVQLADELELGAPPRVEVEQMSRDLVRADRAIGERGVDGVLSAGDGDLDLVAALVASKRGVAYIRLAAGLRGAGGPQDSNRKLVDRLAALRICPDPAARERLDAEGLAEETTVADVEDPQALARTIGAWLDDASAGSKAASG